MSLIYFDEPGNQFRWSVTFWVTSIWWSISIQCIYSIPTREISLSFIFLWNLKSLSTFLSSKHSIPSISSMPSILDPFTTSFLGLILYMISLSMTAFLIMTLSSSTWIFLVTLKPTTISSCLSVFTVILYL